MSLSTEATYYWGTTRATTIMCRRDCDLLRRMRDSVLDILHVSHSIAGERGNPATSALDPGHSQGYNFRQPSSPGMTVLGSNVGRCLLLRRHASVIVS